MTIENFFKTFQNKEVKSQAGFTLLEILLVVAMIAILAGIVIVAINPNKQLAEARNAQRRSDINTILNAVYQYAIDHNGSFPGDLTSTLTEICQSPTIFDCTGKIDLSALVLNEKYLTRIPNDPVAFCTNAVGTCYQILQSANDRITVTAPWGELGATISVTR